MFQKLSLPEILFLKNNYLEKLSYTCNTAANPTLASSVLKTKSIQY